MCPVVYHPRSFPTATFGLKEWMITAEPPRSKGPVDALLRGPECFKGGPRGLGGPKVDEKKKMGG